VAELGAGMFGREPRGQPRRRVLGRGEVGNQEACRNLFLQVANQKKQRKMDRCFISGSGVAEPQQIEKKSSRQKRKMQKGGWLLSP